MSRSGTFGWVCGHGVTAYVRADFKVDDVILVKMIAVDDQNRIKLSRKVALWNSQRAGVE